MRADRLVSIVLLLQTRGKLTSQTLAEELGVSRRTILRDLDALSTAGIPVYAEGGHAGGIALDENYRTTLNGLQESEIATLLISSNAAPLRDLGMDEAGKRTTLKLLTALPLSQRPSLEHVRQRILIDPAWWWHETQPLPFWERLQQAVYEDRRIQMIYENYQGEVVERVVEPYSLVAKSSFWYLIARRDGELRTYRVSRIREISLLDDHFEHDRDYDLQSYWQNHLQEFMETMDEYSFTLRVQPERVGFAKSLTSGRWEIIELSENEWITMRFHLESQSLAKMMVFGLGAQAVVVEPQDLYQSVIDTAREMLAIAENNEYDPKNSVQ